MFPSEADKKEDTARWTTQAIEARAQLLYISSLKKRRSFSNPYSLAGIFSRLRTYRNITVKSLALRFQISEEYISSIEGGRRFGSLKFFLKCANLFNANPNWVKIKWANESVSRYGDRIRANLDLNS